MGASKQQTILELEKAKTMIKKNRVCKNRSDFKGISQKKHIIFFSKHQICKHINVMENHELCKV